MTQALIDINEGLAESVQSQDHPKHEFRGVWITTFTNLDWPSTKGLSSEEQKREFSNLLNAFKKNNMNAVIAQVRASSDAFYPSKYSPWSEWMTGVQGKPPSPYYDPLDYMVRECHKNNMEFHAWFNPLRAISHDRFSSVAKNHITNTKPEWFFHYGESYYYNPGIPEVRDYIVKVIMEVVDTYDVDGVHLDDYFYPYTKKGEKIPDWGTYKKYGGAFKNIEDWRRNNINILVQQIGKAIKQQKSYVKFGISPLAIWRNKKQDPRGSDSNSGQTSYDNLYCDTKFWIENSWVDYVAPQLYWSRKNLYANFDKLLKWWDLNTYKSTHLYIGHAVYKLKPGIRHKFSTSEVIQQVKRCRSNSQSQGSLFFRAQAFAKNYQGFQQKFQSDIFKHKAVPPPMHWIDSIPPSAPKRVKITSGKEGLFITWKNTNSLSTNNSLNDIELKRTKYYSIYRFDDDDKNTELTAKHLIGFSRKESYYDKTAKKGESYRYCVSASDRLHNESINNVTKSHYFEQ